MNTPKIVALNARANQSFGWIAEQLGRAVGASGLIATGRNRQLRAVVTLHCAQVKADANKSMRSWRLLDKRLMNLTDVR
jgi:uncharacterized protein YjbJ (UPF0337 family)